MKKALLILFILGVILPSSVFPCNVPVFKYALDRWECDDYVLLVLHDKPLGDTEKGLIELIEKKYQGESGDGYLNLVAETIDTTKEIPKQFAKIVESQKIKTYPSMILCYPQTYYGLFPVWNGTFTKENVELIADSPARKEVAKRIRSGHSVVWVFLESGKKELDDEKRALLEKELKKNAEEIELPGEEDLVWDLDAEFQEEEEAKEKPEKEKIRPVFSIVNIKRSDPKESLFIDLLLNSEKDLNTFKDQPITFPMFGRGRILFALVGKGINGDMIFESCSYLTGACSCQVKAQNPGFDCLVQTDWDTMLVKQKETPEEEPPVLTSVLTENTEEKVKPLPETSESTPVPEPEQPAEAKSIGKPLLLAGGVIVLLVILGSALILLKKKN